MLLALLLAPPLTAAPHRASSVPPDCTTPAMFAAGYGFLAGMLLGFVLAVWVVWQLVTAADNTTARRHARRLAELFGQTDDIHDLVTRVIQQGHSRINALKDDLERLRKELRNGK